MIAICFLGVFLGAFSLSLVTAIMNGFEKDLYKKMQGIHSNGIIRSESNNLNYNAIKKVLQTEFPQVLGISPTSSSYVLVPGNNNDDIPDVIIVKAIDPTAEATVTTIAQKITNTVLSGKSPLSCALSNNNILMGKKCAQALNLHIGDTVTFLYPDTQADKQHSINLSKQQAQIGGIFCTGIDEYDAHVVFCTFNFFHEMFPDIDITQINIKFTDDTHEQKLLSDLKKRLGIEVSSWKNLYPELVSALTLQKYVSFFIIMLISLVASMNILSLLFMEITNKRPDIAILRTMGASPDTISLIFISIGVGISFIAGIIGIAGAYVVSYICQTYPCIRLPDVYYTSHLPVLMEWHIALTVLLVVLLISFFASWLPTRSIKTLNIAHILRSEG